jgi:hypothetical protein
MISYLQRRKIRRLRAERLSDELIAKYGTRAREILADRLDIELPRDVHRFRVLVRRLVQRKLRWIGTGAALVFDDALTASEQNTIESQ